MRVCLLSTEVFGWGSTGGFGFTTLSLAQGLVSRGIAVNIVIPQPRNTHETQILLNGISIYAYPRLAFGRAVRLLRDINADIYHSQEPSLGTWLAQLACPDRIHLITSQDPRLARDWWIEFRYPSRSWLQVIKTAAYHENLLTRSAVRRADGVYVPAKFLTERVAHKFRLSAPPRLLPNPVKMPATVNKATQPTVCYLGRLDRRKRPQVFFDLAGAFPSVRFIVIGVAQDPRVALELTKRARSNLNQVGFVNQFEDDRLSQILGSSWILVNTSAREGLPSSFIEACAHRCAILSAVDPDGFTTRFGVLVRDGNFATGLARLLQDDLWRAAGIAGYQHVKEIYRFDLAIEAHMTEYHRLIQSGRKS